MAERWQERGNTAQIAAAIASAVSCALAIAAVTVAFLHIQNNKQITRESSARHHFRSYLEAGLRHPNYAVPDYQQISSKKDDIFVYAMFVANLLYACEEILESFPMDQAWQSTCQGHIDIHAGFICENFKDGGFILSTYSERLRALLVRARAVGKSAGYCI
ncbi:hypothetical protein [Bosea sp. (in: a-proteobacteria)]|uniref:hypothetical protein n=1 Tax=Bosea sp. (in: a-proteobacteria) TaxID=1871050 RepID=UPI002B470DCE|nr:hypothetical protein [Bosea sp. (in: a-proteobacteria)]WRH58842.1 MAG: hypothetical protein RSE11_03375 [Bosea sp. (in: a-proteobacteria)]